MAQHVQDSSDITKTSSRTIDFEWNAMTKDWKVDNINKQITKTTGNVVNVDWQSIFSKQEFDGKQFNSHSLKFKLKIHKRLLTSSICIGIINTDMCKTSHCFSRKSYDFIGDADTLDNIHYYALSAVHGHRFKFGAKGETWTNLDCTFTAGDIITYEVDFVSKQIKFYKNNKFIGVMFDNIKVDNGIKYKFAVATWNQNSVQMLECKAIEKDNVKSNINDHEQKECKVGVDDVDVAGTGIGDEKSGDIDIGVDEKEKDKQNKELKEDKELIKLDWESTSKHWKVDNNNGQVTKNKGSLLNVDWQSIFINQWFDSETFGSGSYSIEFKFKVEKRLLTSSICIGIVNTDIVKTGDCFNQNSYNWMSKKEKTSVEYYAVSCVAGKRFANKDSVARKDAKWNCSDATFTVGDTIIYHVNFATKQVKFYKNDKFVGIMFNDIKMDKNTKYKLAVTSWNQNSIKLLACHVIKQAGTSKSGITALNYNSATSPSVSPSQVSSAFGFDNDEKSDELILSDKERFKIQSEAQLEEIVSKLLEINDISWVLVVMNINGLKRLNDNKSHDKGDAVIDTVRNLVTTFCKRSVQRFMAFNDGVTDGAGDQIAILIKCKKSIDFVEKQMKKLFSIIDNSDYSVSAGITAVFQNKNRTAFGDIHLRAIHSLKNAKLEVKQQLSDNKIDHSGKSNYKWDMYDKKLCGINLQAQRNVVLELNQILSKMDTKETYKKLLDKLANDGQTHSEYNWVLVAMDMDNIGGVKKKSLLAASYIVSLFSNEINQLCLEYQSICIGCRRGGDEFSLFIKCAKSDFNIATNIMNQLFENVRSSGDDNVEFKYTFSAGLTVLNDDEMGHNWEDRAEEALKQAKMNGKNRMSWAE